MGIMDSTANDQQFDDDAMLQLALSMSLQQTQSPPATADSVANVTDSALVDQGEGIGAESTPASPPMVESPAPAAESESATASIMEAKPTDASPKKKKKKKNGYAAMMAGVMKPQLSDEQKKHQTDEKLRSGMGGGEFSKLDKI